MLRVAVVGVGYLGQIHARKYLALPDVELVGVSDQRAEAGREFAASCEVAFFAEPRELLGRVDAVTVATSTPAHYELAKLFLDNGVNVFVEKPMTRTSAEGRELTAIAERGDLKLQVGHVERFNPALLSARDRLDAVRFIECHRLAPFKTRGADVNVVLDLMIHDLDVLLSLINSRPASVSAVGIPVLTDNVDIANARIEFDDGAIANVTASRVSMTAQRKFRVFQRNQYLSIDFGTGDVQLVTHAGGWPISPEP
jgi:predicted dehydrogenase